MSQGQAHHQKFLRVYKRKPIVCRLPVIPFNSDTAKLLAMRQKNLVHIWTSHLSLTAEIKFTCEKLSSS